MSSSNVADAAPPHRRMSRIGRAALLAACLAVTVAAMVLVAAQLRQAVRSLQEVQVRELQARGSAIVSRVGQVRGVAEALRDMAETLAANPAGCALPQGAGGVAGMVAAGTPPTAMGAAATCLTDQLRLPLAGGQMADLRRIVLAGPGWSMTADPDGMATAAPGNAPEPPPVIPVEAEAGFLGPLVGPDGMPEVRYVALGDGAVASVAVALATDGMWAQTFPLSGPEGEVLLLARDGSVIVRGGALPGSPESLPLPGPLDGPDRTALLDRIAGGPATFAGGHLLAVLRLPDTDWYLVSAIGLPSLTGWMAERNAALLILALVVTLAAWAAYGFVMTAFIRPSQRLEDVLDRTRTNLTITFDHMAEGICLFDNAGRVVSANGRLTDLLALDADAVRARSPVAPLLHAMGLPAIPGPCQRQARDVAGPEGRWLEAVLSPVEGRPLSILLVRDVTERKTSEIAVRDARDEAEAAYARSEALLLNVLPRAIADRLKAGERDIADRYDSVTVLFADIVDFTPMAAARSPAEVVSLLNRVFSRFDALCERHGVEKLKTIGDGYMAVAGAPLAAADHAAVAARLALDMQAAMAEIRGQEPGLNLRIGLNCGPAVAGIIGTHRFAYDIWGDTVNVASRLESKAAPGTVTVSDELRARLSDRFLFHPLGQVELKGRGAVPAWRLLGPVEVDASA